MVEVGAFNVANNISPGIFSTRMTTGDLNKGWPPDPHSYWLLTDKKGDLAAVLTEFLHQ